MNKAIVLLFVVLLISCRYQEPQEKFDKALWATKEDWDFPARESMINDLVKNHKLKGLSYRQLVDSLGEPANWGEQKDSIGYEIITDFGNDIDPVYTKTLVIKLTKDSMATGFQVEEWRKDD